MPSTYTPDPTATQAPAAQPDPDNYPDLSLPADGDAANAASVAQDFKALGDFIAWLKAPRAAVASMQQAVRKYMNARLQRGHVINNQGILDGRILTTEEDWIDIAAVDQGPGTANGGWFGRWNFGIFGSGGNVYGSPPTTDLTKAPWGPRAGVTIIGGVFPFAQSAAVVEMCKGFMMGGSSYICMEAALSVNPNGVGTLDTADTYSFGFLDGSLISSASVAPCDTGGMASVGGAYLHKSQGDTEWRVTDRGFGGAGGSSSGTGVTCVADTPLRYRLEIIRADTANDNAVHVLHTVNGGTPIDHPTDMVGAILVPFLRSTGQYSGPQVHSVLNCGRIRLTARLEAGDVYP